MNFTDIVDTLAFVAASFILVRIVILIKIDSYRKKNSLFKFVFGVYAFESIIPITRKSSSKEEAKLIRGANICLAIFFTLIVTMLLVIVFKYRYPIHKSFPNHNTEQAMLIPEP